MVRRKKEDAVKTREALLDAAEHVFLCRGVARSSLEEIAKEAGVTRGAVYWHFENKQAIFRAMYDRVKSPMDEKFDVLTAGDDPLEGMKAMALHVFQTLATDEHTRNVFTIQRLRCEESYCSESEYASEARSKQQQVHEKFIDVFTRIGKHHPFADGMTPEFASLSYYSLFSGVLWDYLRDPEHYPLVAIAPQLVDQFFRGLLRA